MMALTLEAEQRLTNAGLVAFFDRDRDKWLAIAKDTFDFVARNFPADATIRRDDVAKALKPIIEVDTLLQVELAESRLGQKYWVAYFTDLIIDRTWAEISDRRET
jgi:hypothetical protein